VSDAEAENLGTNGLILDEGSLVVDAGNWRIAEELRRAGQEVLTLDYDGPIRIGGGMRCSHHPIRRESDLG
jgi:glycine amidinotransferase